MGAILPELQYFVHEKLIMTDIVLIHVGADKLLQNNWTAEKNLHITSDVYDTTWLVRLKNGRQKLRCNNR